MHYVAANIFFTINLIFPLSNQPLSSTKRNLRRAQAYRRDPLMSHNWYGWVYMSTNVLIIQLPKHAGWCAWHVTLWHSRRFCSGATLIPSNPSSRKKTQTCSRFRKFSTITYHAYCEEMTKSIDLSRLFIISSQFSVLLGTGYQVHFVTKRMPTILFVT